MDRPAEVKSIWHVHILQPTEMYIGIERKIREAYRHLCLTYTNKQDEIILIGFSRGAFTVRCLASLVNDVGLIDGQWVNKELPAIFELWKKQKQFDQKDAQGDHDDTPLKAHIRELEKKYDKSRRERVRMKQRRKFLRGGISIKVCAVWDTVKSLGFPWPKRVPHKASKQYESVDYKLTANIKNAFQALSLDERRWHFSPVIWSKSDNDQTLKQCWFLGSHSDIGGGYRNPGFANISLCWMISQLKEFVRFNEKAIWHSTDDGKILGINVAKENRDLFSPDRGRAKGTTNRVWPFPRARSGPSNGKDRSRSRESSRPFLQSLPWRKNTKVQQSAEDQPTAGLNPPSISVSDAASEQHATEEIEIEDILSIPLYPDDDIPDETSLNPEAEVNNNTQSPGRGSLTISDADRSERDSLAIKYLHRHTGQGFWVFGGSKTREIGTQRATLETEEGGLGSEESIHMSVRVLTELYPLRGHEKCKALENFETRNENNRVIWRRKGTNSIRGDIPEDLATKYEQSMLHRWLDQDFDACESLGGRKAADAIAGIAEAEEEAQGSP
ncbi:uncharacterized protein KY384_008553 [Bacidia gigantensis]|uniref:uncharacterized protein n=1 Tax=Bacidia gigantensis TaxID=2732470 RepID=UPI001D05BCFE|nr:uncharacterized protein KY384_008553 [Bacidia gigantensis]KAG8527124.1 hypothetical protein KY384_008553 [Bacidia gigantensis]